MTNAVEIFSYPDIMTIFSQGMVGGIVISAIVWTIGYVIGFLLSLISDKIK